MFMYDVRYGGQKEILPNITWMYIVQHGDGQKEMLLGSAPPTRHHDSTFQLLRSAC